MSGEKGTFAKMIDVGRSEWTDTFGFLPGIVGFRRWNTFSCESRMQIVLFIKVQAVSFVFELYEKCTSLFGRVVDLLIKIKFRFAGSNLYLYKLLNPEAPTRKC